MKSLYVKSLYVNLYFVPVLRTDSYTTEDIVFEWNATDVSVGTEEMAQFGYKGAKLSSDTDVFTTGNQCFFLHSIQLSTPHPSPSLLPDPSSLPQFLRSSGAMAPAFIYLAIFSKLFYHYDHKQRAST